MSQLNNLVKISTQFLQNKLVNHLNEQTNQQTYEFANTYTFEERTNESSRVLQKYPDRIPIICEKNSRANDCPEIDKKKYLVPFDLTIGQFMYVIRKRLKLQSEAAIFLFINGTIPPSSSLVGRIYEQHKNKDGFLYITYAKENTFG